MKSIQSRAHQPAVRCPYCNENMFYLRTLDQNGKEAHWLVCLTCAIISRLAIPPVRFFVSNHELLELVSIEPLKN